MLSTYVSKLMPGKKFRLGTSTNGSHRAILPVGMFERVFPFDMLPSYLLRSVYTHDLEMAEQLGALEFASVEFSGIIREQPSAGPSPFREVWNMTKPKTGTSGWLVAGVQALQ